MKKLSRLKKLTAVFGVAASVVIINTVISYSNTIKLIQISFNYNDYQYINLLKQNILVAIFGNVGILVLFYLLLRSALIHLELTERRLTRTENHLQALINVSECVELIAKDTTLLEINANGIKMMKANNANELVGKRVDTRVEREYVTAFTALHESVCRGNSETLEFEINIQGTRRWVRTCATPLMNEDGTFLNLLVTRDITEEKQLLEQMLRFQRLDTIGCLAGGIAHDLNNVLSAILLSVQLLRMKLPNNQYQNLITTLENNVKRGTNLIKQVLLFARGVEQQTLIDLKTVFSEVELFITQTFPKSIELQITISPCVECVVGNTTQIHQVLMNLLVNARDAMPQGGKLTLAASNHQESNYIVIIVTDTGIGIPPSIIERIFEPFFTTKEVGKGTGLGLSTTKKIIKNHGGFIEVCSKVGEGTCFKVYLPALSSKPIDILPFKIISKDLINKVLINSQ